MKSDDHSTSELHRTIILKKHFLRKLFERYYRNFLAVERSLAIGGLSLEIGSGGGFFKQICPSIITSDILRLPHVDCVNDAHALPFKNNSLKAIYGLQTLHHLGKPKQFFREAVRCLKPNGKICFLEPFLSPFGRFLYTHFHYEPCDYETSCWDFQQNRPLSDSNQALPTIIFKRDISTFQNEFPELRIESIRYHTFLLHALSGGVRYRAFVPNFLFGPLTVFEDALSPLMKWLGTMQTIVLVKKDSKRT